ncbi:phage tail assembly chaperone [Brevibacillus ginsengisoli]|uniref:phage tail assembly chaperone n=1 Tax=Brevibacillus ginsengisoli TaxID=363854 RepID=UPI003CF9CAF8
MQQAVKYKDVEINGRTFRIRKFPARVGSFMIIKLTKILAPMFAGFKPNLKAKSVDEINVDYINIEGVMEQLGKISEEDFNYIQEQALCVCYESLPGGHAPVLNPNGTFGVEGLEDDTVTVMALTVHSLIFNLTSFFQGNGLGGLVTGLISSR